MDAHLSFHSRESFLSLVIHLITAIPEKIDLRFHTNFPSSNSISFDPMFHLSMVLFRFQTTVKIRTRQWFPNFPHQYIHRYINEYAARWDFDSNRSILMASIEYGDIDVRRRVKRSDAVAVHISLVNDVQNEGSFAADDVFDVSILENCLFSSSEPMVDSFVGVAVVVVVDTFLSTNVLRSALECFRRLIYVLHVRDVRFRLVDERLLPVVHSIHYLRKTATNCSCTSAFFNLRSCSNNWLYWSVAVWSTWLSST